MSTSLAHNLHPECVRSGVSAGTRAEVLREIAILAAKSPAAGAIGEEEMFLAFSAREEIGSTGIVQGAAVPHCSFDSLEKFTVGVITVPGGVEFGAPDGAPTSVFFFIVGPTGQRNEHIKLLAGISKVLRNPSAVDRLLRAGDDESLRKTVLSLAPDRSDEHVVQEKCLFTVVVQNPKYFDDALQVLAESSQGSLSIIEGTNADTYLSRYPLYTAYAAGGTRPATRLVLAVVDRSACNETIRRLNIVADTLEGEPGVLITVQELYYSSGALQY